ncbi:MAG: 2-amino-4-hydroxy-6-hydroxymethyldihydropteridine diphosphokinase [Candidatus Gracilibacteria bacterium]
MEKAIILLGANLGDKKANIENAIAQMAQLGKLGAASRLFETEPWGENKDQPFYLNAAVELLTDLKPLELLDALQKIEQSLGREKPATHTGQHYEPRPIDADILFYGSQIIKDERLEVPHPLIAQRAFVLVPLNDIASEFVHPVHKKPIKILLRDCADKAIVSPHEPL